MLNLLLFSAANNCVKTSTAGTVTGLVIILGFIGGIVSLAVANARARRRLTMANAELAYLRPENERLQRWIADLTGSPGAISPETGYSAKPTPPRWSPDPSKRHQLRFWDGTSWTEHVADHGSTSTDPVGGQRTP